jgi:hypothetical protein
MTKLLTIAIFCFLLSSKAQDFLSPIPSMAPSPMDMQSFSLVNPILHGCMNCPSPIQYVVNNTLYIGWSPSISPNVIGYAVGIATNLTFNPILLLGETNGLSWPIVVTNFTMGFPAVRSVNQQGLKSGWRL